MRTALILLLLTCTSVLAGQWSLTDAQFQQRPAELLRVDEKGVAIRDGSVPREHTWDDVVLLQQSATAEQPAAGPFVLHLRDGQRLTGTPSAIVDESLLWSSRLIGDLRFPLSLVRGFARADKPLPQTSDADVVQLANGDALSGIIDSAPGGIAMQSEGKRTNIPWDNISALSLAEVAATAPADPRNLQVRLIDGSILLASTLHLDGADLRMVLGNAAPITVPLANIRSIQNHAGRARFLSSLTPSSYGYAPFATSAASIESGMRLVDAVTTPGSDFLSVISLRPRSVLEYRAPFAGHLHLRYACAEPGELTDMTIRITVEGQTVHEALRLHSVNPSEAVRVPVGAAQAVRVIVDYGENFDVQDRLLLLQAAFIRD